MTTFIRFHSFASLLHSQPLLTDPGVLCCLESLYSDPLDPSATRPAASATEGAARTTNQDRRSEAHISHLVSPALAFPSTPS